MLQGMWHYACRRHRLVSPDVDAVAVRSLNRRILGITGLSVLGTLVAFVDTRVATAIFVCGPLLLVLQRRVEPEAVGGS